ncbi:MAG: class IV adenylate cyclase, partial [Acidobacteria bacterium]|nr:class IV adenylate cyclase [Acidobacteriota bacterium]
MGRETEIKLRIASITEFRMKLKKVGARTVARGSGRVHEFNTLYDTAAADLRRRDELLRIRAETPTDRSAAKRTKRLLLTFKGPVRDGGAAQPNPGANHKIREEIELEVTDAKALGLIFARLGMGESFHYEKYRTT